MRGNIHLVKLRGKAEKWERGEGGRVGKNWLYDQSEWKDGSVQR